MKLVTYLQFGSKYTRFDNMDRHDINKFIDLPDYINLVRISCRLEEEVIYQGEKRTLVSIDLGDRKFDFEPYKNLPDEKRREFYKQALADIINKNRFVVHAETIDNNATIGHFARFYDILHTEFDGKAYRLNSNELKDIKLPKDCKWFETYDRLEKRIKIKDKILTLQSEEVDNKKFIIGDLIEGMVRSYVNEDVAFIKDRDGNVIEKFLDGQLISPRNINEDGSINNKRVSKINYDDVKAEIWGN